MDPVNRQVDPSDLGAAVADVSDRLSDVSGRVAVDRARRAFLAPPVPKRLPVRPRALALAFAACGVLLAVFLWLSAGPRSLTYRVADRAGAVGEWVAADVAPLGLRFSDASTLALAPGARARVTTTTAQGADVLIERGGVHAVIAHATRSTRWTVRAGPFEVRVTGTVFDASWDPTTESFELGMQEGSVVVSGPHLPPERAVVAGERLRVSVREGRMELTTGPASPAPKACAEPVVVATAPSAAPAIEPAVAAPKVAASAVPAASAPASSPPAWKDLAAHGKYREALAAAEAAGFEHEVARASSAADLVLLADAARFGGSPARARAALLSARSRFGARGHTAFLLGKIAADQGGSAGDAATWMETYLREEPGGAFAEQALGRLVELSRRDPEAASRAAARYLARYPNGAHAALARSLVAEKKP
jgi:hypothetical protein